MENWNPIQNYNASPGSLVLFFMPPDGYMCASSGDKDKLLQDQPKVSHYMVLFESPVAEG